MVHSRVSRIGARLALALGPNIVRCGAGCRRRDHRYRRHVVAAGRDDREAGGVPGDRGEQRQEHVEQHRGHGLAAPGFTFLSSTPASSTNGCSQTQPVCTFRQLASGKSLPPIVFYYRADDCRPVRVQGRGPGGRGRQDNSDGSASNIDTFTSNTIVTDVRAFDDDFVAGHSLPQGRSFSTAASTAPAPGCPRPATMPPFPLGAGNPHGTAVTVPTDAEVTASDVAPAADCPAAVTTCSDMALASRSQTARTSPAGSS